MQPIKLYGGHVSLYTAKARAFLLNKRLPFDEIQATRSVYKDIVIPKTGVRYVPVVELPDGRFVQDTSEIIDALDPLSPLNPAYPETPGQRLAALLMECVADEWLLLPAMLFRWTRNRDWAVKQFGMFSGPELSVAQQHEIGEKLCQPFAGALPLLGVTPETTPAIDALYEDFLRLFADHLLQHRYVLGGRPTLADHALMGPLYGHLYRDPRSGEHMYAVAPRVADWVERMNFPPATFGDLAADDIVPEGVVAMLALLWRDYAGVVAGTLDANAAWIAAHPGEELPRAIGQQPFTIGQATGTRMIFPYTQWMWQRVADCWQSFTRAQQAAVQPLVEGLGIAELLAKPLAVRVERVNNKLMPA